MRETGQKKNWKTRALALLLSGVVITTTIASNQIFSDAASSNTTTTASGAPSNEYAVDAGTGVIAETFTAPDMADGAYQKITSFGMSVYVPAGETATLSPKFYQGLDSTADPAKGGVDISLSNEEQTVSNTTQNAQKMDVTFDVSSYNLYVQKGEAYSLYVRNTGSSVSVYTQGNGSMGFLQNNGSLGAFPGTSFASVTYSTEATTMTPPDVGAVTATIDGAVNVNNVITKIMSMDDKGVKINASVASTQNIVRKPHYASSDASIVTVDGNGNLTPKATGDAVITAYVGDSPENALAAGHAASVKVSVVAAALSDSAVTYNPSATNQNHPVVTVTGIPKENYTETWANDKAVGTGSVTIQGTGTYASFSKTLEYTINGYDLTQGFDTTNAVYTRANGVIRITGAKDGNGNLLTQDTDFTAEAEVASQESDGATYKVTVTGKGNYLGTASVTTSKLAYGKDNAIDINTIFDAKLNQTSYSYTGRQIKPGYKISVGGTEQNNASLEGTAYTVSYGENTNVGEGSVTLTGIESNGYKGTITLKFSIASRDIRDALIAGNDGTLSTNVSKAGDITMALNGMRESLAVTSRANGKISMSGALPYNEDGVTLPVVLRMYQYTATTDGTSEQIFQTLVQNRDYTVNYSDNDGIGEAKLKITGTGNYTNSWTITYRLVGTFQRDLQVKYGDKTIKSDNGTFATGYSVNYNGSNQTLASSPILKMGDEDLVAGTDYAAIDATATEGSGNSYYSNNVNAGTAKLTIIGLGFYQGQTATLTYTIKPQKFTQYDSIKVNGSYTYTGAAIKPDPASIDVTINKTTKTAKEWNIGYASDENSNTYDGIITSNSVDAGSASLEIKGQNNFDSSTSITGKYTIGKLDINSPNISVSNTQEMQVTGKPVEPTIEVKNTTNGVAFAKDRDYKVSYDDNTSVGRHTITITGSGDLTGTRTSTFKITERKMDNLTVTLAGFNTTKSSGTSASETTYTCKESDYSATYTGANIKPAFTLVDNSTGLTLEQSTDYQIPTYNSTNPGDGVITVAGAGKYSGSTIKIKFHINKKDISDSDISVSDIQPQYDGDGKFTGLKATVQNTFGNSPVTLSACDEKDKDQAESKGYDYYIKTESTGYAGQWKAVVYGLGKFYKGSKIVDFEIGQSIDATNANVTQTLSNPWDTSVQYQADGEGNYEVPYYGNSKENTEKKLPELGLTFTNVDKDKQPIRGTDYTVTYQLKGDDTITDRKDAFYDLKPGSTVVVTVKSTEKTKLVYGERSFEYKIQPVNLASNKYDGAGNKGTAIGDVIVTDANWSKASNKSFYNYTAASNGTPSLITDATKQGLNYYYNGKNVPIDLDIKYYPGGAKGPTVSISTDEYTITKAQIANNTYLPGHSPITSIGPDVTTDYANGGVDAVFLQGKGSILIGGTAAKYQIQPADLSALQTDDKVFMDMDTTDKDETSQNLPYTNVTPDLTKAGVWIYGKDGDADSIKLVNGTDYSLTLTPIAGGGGNDAATKPGTYTLTATGLGNYKGVATMVVTIRSKEIALLDAYIGSKKEDSTTTIDGETVIQLPDQEYTGSAITTALLKDGSNKGLLLRDGASNIDDYTVSYTNNIYPGQAVITLTGTGLYAGTKKVFTYNIIGNLSDTKLFGLNKNGLKDTYTYDGQSSTSSQFNTDFAKVEILRNSVGTGDAGATLAQNTDYTVDTTSLGTPGDDQVVIKGTGYYKGTMSIPVTMKGDISKATLTWNNGSNIVPYGSQANVAYTLSFNGIILNTTNDYSVSGDTEDKIGSHTITLTGKGNYIGTLQVNYEQKYDLSKTTVNIKKSYKYTGSQVKPEASDITVIYNNGDAQNVTLHTDTASQDTKDYYISYGSNVAAGKGTVTINSISPDDSNVKTSTSYGYKTVDFDITAINLFNDESTKVYFDQNTTDWNKIADKVYTGHQIIPEVTKIIPSGETTAIPTSEYKVTYGENVNAGKNVGTVTIKGNGNYAGEKTFTFNINKKKFENTDTSNTGIAEVLFNKISDAYYSGEYANPIPKYELSYNGMTLAEGTDYEISTVINAGGTKGTITFTAKEGNYTGTATAEYDILARDISSGADIKFKNETPYTGKTISVDDLAKLLNLQVDLGNGKTAELTYSPDQTKDYYITVEGGREIQDAGTYTINLVASRTNKLTGWIQTTFTVTPKDISDDSVKGSVTDQGYTGAAVTPSADDVVLTDTKINKDTPLVEGRDYTITAYNNNVSAASADADNAPSLTVTGTGNYTGSKTLTFNIGTKLTGIGELTLNPQTFTYNGGSQVPGTIVRLKDGTTLTEGVDYTVSTGDTDTVNAGKDKKVTVTGMGEYYGDLSNTYTIEKRKLEGGKIKILFPEYGEPDENGHYNTTYTGKEIKPTDLIVFYDEDGDDVLDSNEMTLVKDSDYKIVADGYKNNKNVSTEKNPAKVTIQLLDSGNYSSTASSKQEGSFYIKPADLIDDINNSIITPTLKDATLSDDAGTVIKREEGGAEYLYGRYAYYDGQEIKPAVVFVKSSNGEPATLEEGKDFTVTYSTGYIDENGNPVAGKSTLDDNDAADPESTAPNRAGLMVATITPHEGSNYTISQPITMAYEIYADLTIPKKGEDNHSDLSVTVGNGGNQFYNYGNPIQPEVVVKVGGHTYTYTAGQTSAADDLNVTETSDTGFAVDTEGQVIATSNVSYLTGSAEKNYKITNDTDSLKVTLDNATGTTDEGIPSVIYKGNPYNQDDLGMKIHLPSGQVATILSVSFQRKTLYGKELDGVATDDVYSSEIAAGTDAHDGFDAHTSVGQVAYKIYFTVNGTETLVRSGDDLVFEILPQDISDAEVTYLKTNTYNTKTIDPGLIVTYQGKELSDEDYSVNYLDAKGKKTKPVNPGEYTIQVNGEKNFSGSTGERESMTVYPDIPRNVHVTGRTKNTITVSWQPGNNLTGHYLRYVQNGTSNTVKLKASTTSYTVTGLDAGTTYTFRVGGYVGDMSSSDPLIRYDYSTTTGTTTVGDVTDTTGSGEIVDGQHGAKIVINNGNFDGFVVYRASSAYGKYKLKAIVPKDTGTVTNYMDSTARAGKTYYYRIAGYKDHSSTHVFADFDIGEKSSPIAVTVQ